jgi:serine/threonine-protein kinase
MATVYLAKDLKHDRPVALKVLRADLGAALGPERFLREIRTTARLQHPHILPIFDSGSTAGRLWFTMPYVEGESLRSRLQREVQLPIDDAVRITREVALALDHAHRHGVVHRDIKPGNILLSDGQSLVADFGVARALEEGGEGRITETGLAVGTPMYMSPEQASGLRTVDGRSDIYSLGCVAYEMLAGEPPFSGPTPQIVAARHLSEPPRSLRVVRPGISKALQATIEKALAKIPGDRYRNAGEFDLALAKPGTVQSVAVPRLASGRRVQGTGPPRILVLPFDDDSPGRDSAYLCTGLADEIITDLARVDARVISRTSANQAKQRGKSLKTLARDLDVQYVVEGSVTHSGERLRVKVKLVDTATESPVLAEVFTGELSNILELQGRLLRWIGETALVRLGSRHPSGKRPPSVPDAAAYELFLRARHEIFQFTPGALARAEAYLKKGLERMGDNTPLLAALGYVYWQYRNAGASADPVYLDRADACAARIGELDPGSHEPERLRGLVAIHRGEPSRAVELLTRVLESNPNDTDALFWLILLHGFRGYPRRAHPLVEHLLSIDPLQPMHQFLPGFVALMEGRFGDAPGPFRQAVEMDPHNPVLRMGWGQALAMAGRRAEAYQVYDALAGDMPGSFFAKIGRFQRLALAGDGSEALGIATDEVLAPACEDPQYAWIAAQCYALAGETRSAVSWLERAIRHGCENYPLLARTDPLLENVRGDPDFQRLMEELRPRWKALRS